MVRLDLEQRFERVRDHDVESAEALRDLIERRVPRTASISLRSPIATLAPRAPGVSAVERPMPRDAPAKATLPLRWCTLARYHASVAPSNPGRPAAPQVVCPLQQRAERLDDAVAKTRCLSAP